MGSAGDPRPGDDLARLETMGRIAAGVAHDFNNLITVISAYAELALRRVPNGAEGHDELEAILDTAGRARGLTRQLLAYTSRRPLVMRTVDVNATVDGLLPLLSRLVGEEVRLQITPASAAVAIRADPSQLEQVLCNLVANARDAMPTGGNVTLSIERLTLDDGAAEGLKLSPGAFVRIRVSDDGIGMDEQTLARVFEPFFTTKEQGHGTGLGLATAWMLARQAGGTIAVSSQPGAGSTFDVLWPATELEAPAPVRRMSTTRSGTGEVVLVVEPEPELAELCGRILEEAGYAVSTVTSAEAAEQWVTEVNATVDLALVSLALPRTNGPALVARLRELVPVARAAYLVSGVPAREVKAPALLQKPFTATDLLRLTRRALEAPPG